MHTPRTDSPPNAKSWFYVNAQREPTGPVTLTELKRLRRSNRIFAHTYVIQEGGDAWRLYAQTVKGGAPSRFNWNSKKGVLLLLTFLPPAGLYALWRSTVFGRTSQCWLTLLAVFVTLPLFWTTVSGGMRANSQELAAQRTAQRSPTPVQTRPTGLRMTLEDYRKAFNAKAADSNLAGVHIDAFQLARMDDAYAARYVFFGDILFQANYDGKSKRLLDITIVSPSKTREQVASLLAISLASVYVIEKDTMPEKEMGRLLLEVLAEASKRPSELPSRIIGNTKISAVLSDDLGNLVVLSPKEE